MTKYKMIFYVDGDNNVGKALQGLADLTPEDEVHVFYGSKKGQKEKRQAEGKPLKKCIRQCVGHLQLKRSNSGKVFRTNKRCE